MLNQLLQYDQQIFIAINKGLSNPLFDYIMPLLRNRFFWTPLYVFLIVFFVRNYKKQGWILILFLLVTFGLADYLTSGIMKPVFERLRPCNDPALKAYMNSLIACGTGFSFPSSHAANHFGIALFLIVVFRNRWKPLLPLALLWAFCISFAQVYVGVHYPVDVTTGAIIGSIIGYITGTIYLNFYSHKTWPSGS
ncbi:phosphatase PAP2 family protein [Rubrolithibacter danxiaensis]|uniref:phosphatase PAP2 family protein n=1 Tax=Rubrolithibacter danxiaensis TaxID=3390805 RepID=UPI003BF8F80F